MMKNKKAFIGMWSDVIKGFFFGLIVGIALVLLVIYNVIPLPLQVCPVK